MSQFVWRQLAPDHFGGECGALRVSCRPLLGLSLDAGDWQFPQLLGLEVVTAAGLRPQPLSRPGVHPDVVLRQDILLAQFAPPLERFVECQARWRVAAEGVFDLEVSALTPGNWHGLAVQTLSVFPQGELDWIRDVSPAIAIYRPTGRGLSYVEFCHPHDGVDGQMNPRSDRGAEWRFQLFGHDLEKGVILRGRLRGLLAPRAVDRAFARAAYDRFLAEPPHLAW